MLNNRMLHHVEHNISWQDNMRFISNTVAIMATVLVINRMFYFIAAFTTNTTSLSFNLTSIML
jgi:hypothetical protein